MIQQIQTKVKSNELIADKIYKLVLSDDFDLNQFLPGKFIHIKCADGLDPLLRRPMSICNINDSGDEMVVLYRADGKGTKLLSQKNPADELDMLAPLGVEFPTEQVKAGSKVLMIGGGIGVPPLYYLSRKLKAQGAQIKAILGFNAGKDVFYEDEFKELGETHITTIDGSHGHPGLVTDLMDEDYDLLYTCGPTAMIKAVQAKVPEGKLAYMSLEERMACGIGACLACVSKSTDPNCKSYNRVCTEGPVFPINSIDLL